MPVINRHNYPTNNDIEDVAIVTPENNQLWHFWCVRLGVKKVREICQAVNAPRADFSAVHDKLVAQSTKLAKARRRREQWQKSLRSEHDIT